PPEITGDTLPEEGTTTVQIWDRFTLSFSKDLRPGPVNDSASYELRGAGPDGVFGTGDDELYAIATTSNYSTGLNASYLITDGPLQPGLYRFTVFPVLEDLSGNVLAEPYVREFAVEGVEGFILERRGSDSRETATSLSLQPDGGFDGSFGEELIMGVASNPRQLKLVDLDGNGLLDAVVSFTGSNDLRVYPGNGDGTFGTPLIHDTGGNAWAFALGDYNGNGLLDAAVASESQNRVEIWLNDGAGGFGESAAHQYGVGSNPREIVAGDVTGNGELDLVVACRSANEVRVLVGQGDGSFQAGAIFALSGSDPRSVWLADLDGDGRLDIVAALRGSNALGVWYSLGGGDFSEPLILNGVTNPEAVSAGDLTGDGVAEIVTLPGSGRDLLIYVSDGSGGYEEPVVVDLGSSTTNREVRLTDVDGDGLADVLIARGNTVQVVMNLGGLSFNANASYAMGSTVQSAEVADLDGDGRPDLVSVNSGNNRLSVRLGLGERALEDDPIHEGVNTVALRGNLADSNDVDFFSFTGRAGQRVLLGAETPFAGSSSGLNYRIERPDGGNLFNVSAPSNGRVQASALLPVDGRYYVRVGTNWNYFGEYRVLLTLIPGEWQVESEGNDTVSAANTLNLAFEDGVQRGQVFGYIRTSGDRDVFALGNLGEGTEIRLARDRPSRSSLEGLLEVLDAGGTVVAAGAPGEESLSFTIPAEADGAYFASIRGEPHGLFERYFLWVELEDRLPPEITGDTLPEEGTTTVQIWDRFTLSFSKDLRPGPVNDSASYELRGAGPDGVFGTGDDELYAIATTSNYSTGLNASYLITDGPLQPGLYRFTVFPVLEDLSGNVLAEPYVREFAVEGVEGFILERRGSDSRETATSLSLQPDGGFDGSFGEELIMGVASNPRQLKLVDLDGNGLLDAVVSFTGSNDLRVYPGNGDGTFGTPLIHDTGGNAWAFALGDYNGNGLLDAAVASESQNRVEIWLNDGAGGFGESAAHQYGVGSNPREIVAGDVTGNGELDLVVACRSANEVRVLVGQGDGSFQAGAIFALSGSDPRSVWLADLDGDGRLDIVAALRGSNALGVWYSLGGGDFSEPLILNGVTNPEAVSAGDLTGDGVAEIVTLPGSGRDLLIYVSDGSGGYEEPVVVDLGSSTTNREVRLTDVDGDGLADVLIARGNTVQVVMNLGGLSFNANASYAMGSTVQSAEVADLDGDGRPDLVSVNSGNNRLSVRLGLGERALEDDPIHEGVNTVALRGNLADSNDVDFFSFTGRAGQRVLLGAETPFAGSSSGLNYRIERPDGGNLFNVSAPSNGRVQASALLPVDGRYYVRVDRNWNYFGEYRALITLVPGEWQVESEGNDTVAAANTLNLSFDGVVQRGRMFGYIRTSGDRDVFRLGNLSGDTEILLEQTHPDRSSLEGVLEILDSDGTVVASAPAGFLSLEFTVPAESPGAYFASIRGAPHGLFEQYLLTAELQDRTPPFITSTTLPAEGSTITHLLDQFQLGFSEDLTREPVNAPASYELRNAGPDGVFGTSDDLVYAIQTVSNYTGGLTANYRIVNAPIQPGLYRLTVFPVLSDLSGNLMAAPFVREFTVAPVPGFTLEQEPNNSIATATPVVLTETQPGLVSGGGRGRLDGAPDVDFWRFEAQAGDTFILSAESIESSSSAGLNYRLIAPDGSQLFNENAPSSGSYDRAPYQLPQDGVYALRIDRNWNYYGEYRFWVSLVRDLQVELEPNHTLATANALEWETIETGRQGTVFGVVRTPGDLDYFNLGTLNAGTTVFLSARTPASSPLSPVVSLYNAEDVYQPEAGAGRPFDGVAEVTITQTGVYYALVRGGGGTGGLGNEYLLDVLNVATGGVTFPNLVVTEVFQPDAADLRSGELIEISFRVENLGSLATQVSTWFDKVVLSTDTVFGNENDIELGLIRRDGVLQPGEGYTVTTSLSIPDGISGSFYLGVYTDFTNTVNEFLLEGDNVTFSESAFPIALADYPDLVVEDLVLDGPDADGHYTISWTTANRGVAPAPAGFSDRVRVRQLFPEQVLISELLPVESELAPDASLARQTTFTLTQAGNFIVEVATDALNEVFEYNEDGAVAALLNNTATVPFTIARFFTISVSASPPEAGSVGGGGIFLEGTPVTVTAEADTSELPWFFSNWSEGGFLRSNQAAYTFTPNADRELMAVFRLPTYTVAATVQPAGRGTVSGAGSYAHGSVVSLGATPQAGYLFEGWYEGGERISEVSPLEFTLTGNRQFEARFVEANPIHTVTTATSPAGLAEVGGAGVFANGEISTFSAPAVIESGDFEYTFQRFTLNGQNFSTQNPVDKTWSTLDPAEVHVVAVYQSRPLRPQVIQVTGSLPAPVRGLRDYRLTLRFDRPMDPASTPVVELIGDGDQPQPGGGEWLTVAGAIREWRTAPVQFAPGNDGAVEVRASAAVDAEGRTMDAATVFTFTVDATPPPVVQPVVAEIRSDRIRISWTDYPAPADLNLFRYYREDAPFASLAGLESIGGGSASARSHWFTGLEPDRPYHVAVGAVDSAGNMDPQVASLEIIVASDIPPPAPVSLTRIGLDAARLNWTYSPAGLLGFDGFHVYRSTSPLGDLEGLEPAAQLPASARSHTFEGLDRTETYHLAVVPVNRLGQFDPEFASLVWIDPLSGPITQDLTLGGPDEVVEIVNPMIVQEGAALTLLPGTTVRFGGGAGITVENGMLSAPGLPLLPIQLTSMAEATGAGAPGDWAGILLDGAAAFADLAHTWIRFGDGVRVRAGSLTGESLHLAWNAGSGLAASQGGQVSLSDALILFHETGVRSESSAEVAVANSVIRGGPLAAAAAPGAVLTLDGIWFGTTDGEELLSLIEGPVQSTQPLVAEPVLGSGAATAGGVTQVTTPVVSLQLAGPNAIGYRIGEDSTFAGVLFSDIEPQAGLPEGVAPAPFTVPVALSEGAGVKTLFVEFRSLTGAVTDPATVEVEFLADGPQITAFSLSEGQILNRPVAVSAAAESPVAITSLELFVDDVPVLSSSTAELEGWWDLRALSPGIKRVRLEARDAGGGLATRSLNVLVQPVGPDAPVITLPQDGLVTNAGTVDLSATVVPGVTIRVIRNGTILQTLDPAFDRTSLELADLPLVEGANNFSLSVSDVAGNATSAIVRVNRDTMPPLAAVLEEVVFEKGVGLIANWRSPETGKQAAFYQLLANRGPLTSVEDAEIIRNPVTQRVDTIRTIGDGEWTFAVVGIDHAGNQSPLSNTLQLTLDTTPPSFTIAYDKAPPVGPGPLVITLTASEPLQAPPSMTLRPQGFSTPISVPLTQTSPTVFTTTFTVSEVSANSGPAVVRVSAADLAGNSFSGSPSGPALSFDVTRPTGAVTLDTAAPVQVLTPRTLAVNLTLSKPAPTGTPPSLSFIPPEGGLVEIGLVGSGSSWSGLLQLDPEMGSGEGSFQLSTVDALGNSGSAFTSGGTVEIYNTQLPSPPSPPIVSEVKSLPGGYLEIRWGAANNAQFYRLYRAPGGSTGVPTELVADDIADLSIQDLPPEDGVWRYAVTAVRLGSESNVAVIAEGLSDRTPPHPPEEVTAALGARGIVVSWSAPSEGETPHSYVVYRNGSQIRTSTLPTVVTDSPPRGLITYEIGARDAIGNESRAAAEPLELFVNAVNDLVATVNHGQSARLTWTSDDPTATGFWVYRDGQLLTSSPLTSPLFNDNTPLGAGPVEYRVTALNAEGQESAARVVEVYPLALSLRSNPDEEGNERRTRTHFFNRYEVTVANASPEAWGWEGVTVRRTAPDVEPAEASAEVGKLLEAGASAGHTVVMRGPPGAVEAFTFEIEVSQVRDPAEGRALYRRTLSGPGAELAGAQAALTSAAPPLAGGLNTFQVELFNRGHAPIDIILTRGGGSEPGDLSIVVLDEFGEELSRTFFQGQTPGLSFLPGGVGYVRIEPGSSFTLSVPEVFVPASLGALGRATFRVEVSHTYHRLGQPDQRAGSPLRVARESNLVETPYFGLAETASPSVSNDDPIHIFGQAIDRETGEPLGLVPLKIGFSARGMRWFREVETDADGNFEHTYNMVPGFAGTLRIWAAHPDIVDSLDQAEVQIHRLLVGPARANIRMSKNDTLDFDLELLNPGELPLGGVEAELAAFVLDEHGEEMPVPGLSLTAREPLPAELPGNSRRKLPLRLQADLEVPDFASIRIRFQTTEGASATFRGELTLLPANPILRMVRPRVGYVDVGLNRGDFISREVTLENAGLRDLEGVELIPPKALGWMFVNLPANEEGRILLPDLGVGESLTFTVVFAPPEDMELGLYDDYLLVTGTNAVADYRVNLFATVTSSETGEVEFYVDNTLVLPVPNAAVSLFNSTIRQDAGPFLTDAEGRVRIPDLVEGRWQFTASAPGHAANSGSVEVVAGQVVEASIRLYRSVVTVNFSVVPVPFTDRYEIRLETTFETRVPAPVIFFTPPKYEFFQVEPGFETTVVYTLKNEGLISVFDVEVNGSEYSWGGMTPLVEFIPELRAQQSVDIPFIIRYDGAGGGSGGAAPAGGTGDPVAGIQSAGDTILNCAAGAVNLPDGDFLRGLAALTHGDFECADGIDAQTAAIAVGLLHGLGVAGAISSPASLAASLGSFLGCLAGNIIGASGGGGGGGGANPRGGGTYGGMGNVACFAPDTPITLADGRSISVSELVAGMEVQSAYGVVSPVRTVQRRFSDDLLRIVHRSPWGGAERVLKITGDHRVWVDGEGWKFARELWAGDRLIDRSGQPSEVIAVEGVSGVHEVFNLQLAGDNSLYAGGVLVEDVCGGVFIDSTAEPEVRP
ncbi:MAG: hypothetical protein EA425_01565, partial [Puniceicoccaceae bacterium]